MTLNSDDKTDRALRKAQTINGVNGVDGDTPPATPSAPAPPVHSVLDSVCRSATELAKAVHKPPQRIRLQYGHTSVEVEWPQERPPGAPPSAPPSLPNETAAQEAYSAHDARQAHTPAAPRYLCAPTVGTFYHSPEPGAPPYVAVGDLVRPGQHVGVLEVMKMMSPVEADAAGRVVEILVPDAQPVEYQQRLIVLEPLSDQRVSDVPEG